MLNTLDELRRFTVARNFFKPTTLERALHRMGFVQADPIRAPARAQDLILRHRVKNYHAGELERRYATLDIEEDFFVTYGFVTRSLHALMHPRPDSRVPAEEVGSPAAQRKKAKQGNHAQLLLDFVRERGAVHPREVDEHFSHGTVKNYWGGSSNATTHLLDAMHYRGLLRVARREKGIRIYSAQRHELPPTDEGKGVLMVNHAQGERATAERRARIDALVDVAVHIYAPLPGPSLSFLVNRLRYAAPQWQTELTRALQRAKARLSHARIDDVDWYWAAKQDAVRGTPQDQVRLLAPFDPVVRDRNRFELLWGWVYRFEAYTPARRRKLGYYAMPLLWRDRVIGWANLAVKDGALKSEFGYAGAQPRDRVFKRELEAELNRMRAFLGLGS
jgi:uncharacterized protein YcaQ